MNVVAFLIAMGFFVFGMWVFSIAPELAGFEAVTFFGGILCVVPRASRSRSTCSAVATASDG